MIIAYGMLVFSIVGLLIGLFAFRGALKKEYNWKFLDSVQMFSLFCLFLWSAQYIYDKGM